MTSSKSKSLAIFLLSLSALPVTYTVNSAQDLAGEVGLLVAGVVALTLICGLTYVFVGSSKGKTDSIYYVLIIGTFASVVDFIIGLEGDGYISGFMTNYLKNGEPYLKTPMGTIISYWDGSGHYSCYLYMLYALAYKKSYHKVGLFWAGAIGHSMVVYIPGIIMGETGLRWSFLLNIPYMIMPFTTGARFLQERPKMHIPKTKKNIMARPLDWLFIAGLILSSGIAVIRGFAAMGCRHDQFKSYIINIEPYIMEPEAFPMIQMVVYLFNYFPYYMVTIASLLGSEQGGWMADWALIHAGAAAQGQVTHIVSSLHPRTDPKFYPPPAAMTTFWLINVGLLVFPQLLALRLNYSGSPDASKLKHK